MCRLLPGCCCWVAEALAQSSRCPVNHSTRLHEHSPPQALQALIGRRPAGGISITEQIDTSTPMGKAMFTMISALAEFERSLISERVRAGIAKARAQGKRHGRARIDPRVARDIRRLRQQKKSLGQIAKQLGVSRRTVVNYS